MLKNKRIRIFAGPNGSGKSSLFKDFAKEFNAGYFINADLLEKELSETGLVDIKAIGLSATQEDLVAFKKTSQAKSLIQKAKDEGHDIDVTVNENFIVDKSKKTHSYEGSFVASFLRYLLINAGKSFSFETVMSHFSKIKEIQESKASGYKVYLYFICIDDPVVNISRVANRVDKGGHFVSSEKIIGRYSKVLQNLHAAINLSYRTYLFDNSGKKQEMIAEIFEDVLELKVDNPPNWFIQYVLPHYHKQ